MNKLAKNFSFLMVSGITVKIFGVIREVLLAGMFGSHIIFANFLQLRSIADLFTMLVNNNTLNATLLPKFVRLSQSQKLISYKIVKRSSYIIASMIFFILLIVLTIITIIVGMDLSIFIFVNIILALSSAILFYTNIGFIVHYSQNNYKNWAIGDSTNSFLNIVLLYPFMLLWGVVGVALSRLAGILALNSWSWRKLSNENSNKNILIAKLKTSDFNFHILIASGVIEFLVLFSRIFFAIKFDERITYFNYAFVLLNIFNSLLVNNVNKISLNFLSKQKNYSKYFLVIISTIFLGILFAILINLFSYDIIKMIYLRGNFTNIDVQNVSNYLINLTIPLLLLSLAKVLMQSFFAIPKHSIRISKFISYFVIVSTIIFFILVPLISDKNIVILVNLYLFINSIYIIIISLLFIYLNATKNIS